MELQDQYEKPGFREWLRDLTEKGLLSETESGIAKYYLDNGYDALSDKQKYVFDNAIKKYSPLDKHNQKPFCNGCSEELEWYELDDAKDNGGYCNDCWEKFNSDK